MPNIDVNGTRLHYVEQGSGPETVVFSHSYLLDGSHFKPQIENFSNRYRCLAFDHRGHGGSDRPESGYDMDNLYADALAFIEAMDCGPVHFVGLSTGGFIGLRIGFRRPDVLRSLTLMGTSAEPESAANHVKYEIMLRMVQVIGVRPLAGYVMSLFFSKASRSDPSRELELRRFRQMIVDNDADSLVRFGRGIFGRQSVTEHLAGIDVPTQVIVGSEDRSQPPTQARRIADRIPGAQLLIIPGAAHVSTIDAPEEVNEALDNLWQR